MKRDACSATLAAVALLAGVPPPRSSRCRRSRSIRRRSAEVPGQHPPRRGRRRRDQFQGRRVRLHAHRPSDDLARHGAAVRARRLAAVPVRSGPASSFARSDRTRTDFMVAQQVRVDPQDNIWVVDQMSSMVIKFDPNGQVQMLLGRKVGVGARAGRAAAPPAAPAGRRARARRRRCGSRRRPLAALRRTRRPAGGTRPRRASGRRRAERRVSTGRPTSRGTRPATSTSPTATATPAIAKFDKNGKFIKSWGSARDGARPVQHAARDRDRRAGPRLRRRQRQQAHPGLRRRRQLQDAVPERRHAVGDSASRRGPRQFLYSSNSNPPDDIDVNGEIYKVDLNGKLVGNSAGRGSCRRSSDAPTRSIAAVENEL